MGRAVLLVTLAGCAAGDFTERAHQQAAVELVWRQLLGETSEPPPIEWREPECGEPVTWFGGYTSPHSGFCLNGKCEEGYYAPTPQLITLVWLGKIYRSALGHELLHAHLHSATGDLDGDHLRPEWYSGILDDAQSELMRLDY